jgi:osmotically-inducible protein OsmY
MKKTLIALVCCSLITAGCAPVIVAGAAGTSAAYDDRTLSTMYQDEGITHEALGLIKDSPELQETHISIVTLNGIMLLVGQAPSEKSKTLAYTTVKSIPEVKKIYNEITIGASTSAGTRSNDAWITTKVKTAMLTTNGLQSTQVKVLTEDSTVYLLGIVTTTEAEQAVQVAKHIKGVKKVVKLFQIKKPAPVKNAKTKTPTQ